MTLAAKQPEVRFNKAGPFSNEGIAFVPKTIVVEKTATGTTNDDFFLIPAGSFVSRVVATVITALNGTPVVEFGVDGNPDMFIDATDFDASTAGNWATNIGSATAAGANGMYFAAADNLRVAVSGSGVSSGKVRFLVEYYELAAMADRIVHFSL